MPSVNCQIGTRTLILTKQHYLTSTCRYARFDGIETIAYMFGSFLSPYVFEWGGNWASFITELTVTAIGVLYLVFVVK